MEQTKEQQCEEAFNFIYDKDLSIEEKRELFKKVLDGIF